MARPTLDDVRSHCLKTLKGVSEDMPFGDEVLVFRVAGKIFLLAMIEAVPFQFNVKCDPERAIEHRERYEAVQPGYHMNKKHWNTVIIDGSVPVAEVFQMIDHSYDLVSRTVSKARKAAGVGALKRQHMRRKGGQRRGRKS
jgi:predicted DNA-binding protein (MmcQ/YjbR family)